MQILDCYLVLSSLSGVLAIYINKCKIYELQGPFRRQEGQLAGEREQITGDVCSGCHGGTFSFVELESTQTVVRLD